MTKFKKVLLGGIGACLLAALPLAQAQNTPQDGPASPKWQHNGQRIQEIYNQIDLTADQKKQLEDNKQQQRAKMQNKRQKMKAYKQSFQEELMKAQLDLPKVYAIHAQIKALQSQMEDDRLSSILAVRAILTPEQFSKFTVLTHKHKNEEHF